MRIALAVLLLLSVSGCSIKQNVTPAAFDPVATPEICMIPDTGLRAGFHTVYREQLMRKGFKIREMTPGTESAACALSTRYTANWAWDLAMYMVYADIRVFQDGRQVGQATYDAKWGGGRLDKFIDAENKIIELTDQLFPRGAPKAAALPVTAHTDGAPLSKNAYRELQLQRLMDEGLSYDEYQRRYQQLMAQ